nr:hypothetical protein [Candidatus Sigynarchaeum springense]
MVDLTIFLNFELEGIGDDLEFPELERFSVHMNRLQGLPKIVAPKLKHLGFSDGRLDEMEQYLDCISAPQIESINLLYCRIPKISGLKRFPKTRQLGLNGNRLTRFDGVEEAPEIKVLIAKRNPIQDVSCLKKLPSLRFLTVDKEVVKKHPFLRKKYVMNKIGLGDCLDE